MYRLMVKLLMILAFGVFQTQAYALPSDRQETIHVSADSADLSHFRHKGVYKGNVELIQGTTNLRAAFAETYGNKNNQLTLAVAKGNHKNQAHYWTMTDKEKPILHAYADTIEYKPLKHLIILIGRARVEQGTNSFTSARIVYDTVKQHVVSESNEQTRTTIVLYPDKKLS